MSVSNTRENQRHECSADGEDVAEDGETMRRSVVPDGTRPVEPERPKDGLHQGAGALLLLAGSALVMVEPRVDESLFGGLGLLLLLLGSGLMLVHRP